MQGIADSLGKRRDAIVDLIISSGYPSPFANVAEELAASNADPPNWFPMTVDFRATAAHSGGAGEAASFEQLLNVIGKSKPGTISELGLIGHASPTAFALSGQAIPGNIRFDHKGLIHPDTIQDNLEKIKALRNRFKTDDKKNPASITLFACDAGSGDALLEAISSAFQVAARGFSQEIWWCFTTVKGAALRGRTWYDAVGAGMHPRCESSEFSADIRVWRPDKQKGP
jgi:hypothetical protein